MKYLYTLLVIVFLAPSVFCQYQIGVIPRVSPDKGVYQKIGFTEVEIKYGSPSVNDRHIWGTLVPYDAVWRAGANNATTVSFSSPVTINGLPLDSGTYAFFLIPRENDEWTAIFSNESKQWGAFSYTEQKDALRTKVMPRTCKFKTEKLTYVITQTGYKYGSIVLSWNHTEIEIPFETNYQNEFQQVIESRASTQPKYVRWVPYLQGAAHLEKIKANLDLAKNWINQAENLMNTTIEWNDQFYPRPYVKGHVLWTKAKILAWDKHYSQAADYVSQLKALQNTFFYDRQNEKEGIDLSFERWKGSKE